MMPYCAECGGNHELTTGGCSAAGMSNGRCAMNYEAIAKEILELAAQGDADRWIHKFDAKAAAILRAHFPNRQAFAPDAQVSAIFSDDQYALIISDDAQTQEIVLSEATMHSLLDALNGLFDDRQNISVGQTVDARDLVHRILAIGHDTTRKMPCIDDCAAEIEAAFQSRLADRWQEGADADESPSVAYDEGFKADVASCAKKKLVARAEAAETKLAEAIQYRNGHLPSCSGTDGAGHCECGYLDGTAYRDLVDKLAASEERERGLMAGLWMDAKSNPPSHSERCVCINRNGGPFFARYAGREWLDDEGLLRDPVRYIEIRNISAALRSSAPNDTAGERLTSEEWQKRYKGTIDVLDPDGWNRDERFNKEWYEDLITEEEWLAKTCRSTCQISREYLRKQAERAVHSAPTPSAKTAKGEP